MKELGRLGGGRKLFQRLKKSPALDMEKQKRDREEGNVF